jgi:hypothetical protein
MRGAPPPIGASMMTPEYCGVCVTYWEEAAPRLRELPVQIADT